MSNPPTASDFSPEVLQLFDRYVRGVIDRRGFLEQAGRIAAGAATLLEALNPKFAEAQQVRADDKRLHAEYVELPAPGYGKLRAYQVRPKKPAGRLPAVLVIHEAFTYAGTQHGLHNDTTPRFDANAAKLAWERTIALFERTLK